MNRSGPIWIIRTKPKSGEPVDVSNLVLEFTYEDDEKAADKLTMRVLNWDLSQFANPTFAKGTILTVQWGYPGNLTPAREVVVQSMKGNQILTVEALDKGILANKVTKSRTFENMTRSDVVTKIATEEGYDATHIEKTPIVYEHIVQARMTNAQFLKYLAGQEGFEFFIDFDGLHWHRKNLGQAPIRELVWFADRTGTLIDFNVDNDITAKPAAVVQKGRDPIAKQNFEVTGDDANTKRVGSPILEAIDPRTAQTYDTLPKGTATTSPTTEPHAEAAQRTVDGQFRQAQITLVQLTGCKMIGDPNFLAKTTVKLSNLSVLSGIYYVTKAKHTVNASGFIIEFDAKRDGKDHSVQPTKPVPSKASPNDQPVKDQNALQPIDKIDPRTATTSLTVFTDTRGRSSGVS